MYAVKQNDADTCLGGVSLCSCRSGGSSPSILTFELHVIIMPNSIGVARALRAVRAVVSSIEQSRRVEFAV